ncbi:hypothetical protein [Oribacterium sp. FC2011]|uniref:hypothetical protein n=1 Tax=Oribacterium sp. FC2011 TaxID=1408311 RepID=UPI0004E0D2CD|nr:hypothetical protein [Oribacterium sp. FC2011]
MNEKLKNEIKNEKKKLSRMTFGQKAEYIFEYYKFPIIVTLVVIILVVSVLKTLINNKPLGFYAMFLNGSGQEMSIGADELEKRFAEYAEIDGGKEKVVIDTTASFNPNVNSQYTIAQNAKITALFASHDLDAMVIDPGVFTYYALSGAFSDLREVLSEEEFRRYEEANKIYYIDGYIKEKMKSIEAGEIDAYSSESGRTEEKDKVDSDQTSGENIDSGKNDGDSEETLDEMEQFAADLMGKPDVVDREEFEVPDPEKMKDPIPVGIIVTDTKIISDGGFFAATVPVFGVPVVSDRKDIALKFLVFLEG